MTRGISVLRLIAFPAALFFLCLLLAGCLRAQKAETLARVVRVIDGDSYVVVYGGEEHQVRAIGVDAPEASAGAVRRRGETSEDREISLEVEMGRLAAAHAASLLPSGAMVSLIFDPANEASRHRDRYGRLLAFVYLLDENGKSGEFVNERMVADGSAGEHHRRRLADTRAELAQSDGAQRQR